MRYAITSDLHLRTDAPGRLVNLEQILKLLLKEKIQQLIVAGDLFDRGYAGYKALDGLLKKYSAVHLTAITGNHDPDLSSGQFSASNITVVTQPEFVKGTRGELSLFLLPYRPGMTMGEAMDIPQLTENSGDKSWVLISHGDYGVGTRKLCGGEDGYFPLTRADIARYRPGRVILGHIHKPNPIDDLVVYPGSPYPLDITETGRRRILILDTADGGLESMPLPFAPCNLHWRLFVVPDGTEAQQVESRLKALKQDLDRSMMTGIRVRLSVAGCAADRAVVESAARNFFEDSKIQLESLDTSALSFGENRKDLGKLAAGMEEALQGLVVPDREIPGDRDLLYSGIREQALRYIYRIKE